MSRTLARWPTRANLSIKKILVWGLWAVNLGVIVGFWLSNATIAQLFSGDWVIVIRAIGRLLGLLATFCALTQFMLMGRVGWLEPIYGMDRLAIFHRFNGYATFLLIVAHSSIITATHFLLSDGQTPFGLPYVWLAIIAETLIWVTVGLSIYIVRKHLKFETWYAVHLLNYLAIAIVPFHQLTNGQSFATNPVFAWYWIGLYAFVALHMLIWRFGMSVFKHWRYDFKVEKTVQETPTATSVYITGKNLDKYRAKGGQFVLVRFFDKRLVLQEHPFSLSMLPSPQHLRLTIRQLGDFTNMMPQLKPGTPVWVSGPFGAFTHQLQTRGKVLYIAGGIGITPIRSMLEERAKAGKTGSAVMLYGNRTQADTALLPELQSLAAQLDMPLYNVLSEQKDYQGEKGYVDKEKLARLVPDVAERDVFLCGPPPMMKGARAALTELGVPEEQVHYERFSLHG